MKPPKTDTELLDAILEAYAADEEDQRHADDFRRALVKVRAARRDRARRRNLPPMSSWRIELRPAAGGKPRVVHTWEGPVGSQPSTEEWEQLATEAGTYQIQQHAMTWVDWGMRVHATQEPAASRQEGPRP